MTLDKSHQLLPNIPHN